MSEPVMNGRQPDAELVQIVRLFCRRRKWRHVLTMLAGAVLLILSSGVVAAHLTRHTMPDTPPIGVGDAVYLAGALLFAWGTAAGATGRLVRWLPASLVFGVLAVLALVVVSVFTGESDEVFRNGRPRGGGSYEPPVRARRAKGSAVDAADSCSAAVADLVAVAGVADMASGPVGSVGLVGPAGLVSAPAGPSRPSAEADPPDVPDPPDPCGPPDLSDRVLAAELMDQSDLERFLGPAPAELQTPGEHTSRTRSLAIWRTGPPPGTTSTRPGAAIRPRPAQLTALSLAVRHSARQAGRLSRGRCPSGAQPVPGLPGGYVRHRTISTGTVTRVRAGRGEWVVVLQLRTPHADDLTSELADTVARLVELLNAASSR